MTNPNDPHDADFRATLPVDLQDLDRELSGIRIEERPSFAPELEGELLRTWKERSAFGSNGSRRWLRTLMAAGLAGLMIAGVSVPSARAAVFQFVRAVAEEARSVFKAPEPAIEGTLPEVRVREPAPTEAEPRAEMEVSPMDASDEVAANTPESNTLPRVTVTFPEILSRQDARRIIASHYPPDLQAAGVEGAVKLLFWVNGQGQPEDIQVRQSSGHPELDYAAMRAARELRFRPATRNGVAVGTWVEIGVRYYALSGVGIIGSDSLAADF